MSGENTNLVWTGIYIYAAKNLNVGFSNFIQILSEIWTHQYFKSKEIFLLLQN